MSRFLRMTAWSLLLGVQLLACKDDRPIPTYRVEERPFNHRVTVEGTLKAAQATVLTVPSEVRGAVRLAWVAAEGTVVEEGDVIARFDPKPMESRLVEGRSDLDRANLRIGKSQVEGDAKLADHETALQVAELQLDFADRYQKVDDAIYSRHAIIESEIDHDLALHRKTHATEAQTIQRQLSQTELELLGIEQRKANLRITQAEDALAALEVKAPHSGILTLVRNWRGEEPQVGSEMWSGLPIGEIPNLGKMEAEVFVLEADAGGLEAGKPATVVLEAHPDEPHEARIARVEAVAKPRFRDSPVQYFGITLELLGDSHQGMKPGQRVRASLQLAELEQAIVVPRQAVFQDGDVYRVYVRNGAGFAPRQVEIGSTSLALVVITEGLETGEVIALERPASGEIDGKEAVNPTATAAERQPTAALGGGV